MLKISKTVAKGTILKLTIDLAFQDSVDNLLKSYFNSELGNGGARYSEGVYAVALNPKQVQFCLCQGSNMI